MKKMKLSTAVLMAVGAFCKSENGFTFHDVFAWMSEKIKSKEIIIDDLDLYPASKNGNLYWDAQCIFTDLFYNIFYTVFDTKNGVVFKLKKNTLDILNEKEQKNNYSEIEPEIDSSNNSQFGESFEQEIIYYIESRQNAGKEPVTIKQIQSRFKDHFIRCDEYVEILKELGFVLKKAGPISKWTINFDA